MLLLAALGEVFPDLGTAGSGLQATEVGVVAALLACSSGTTVLVVRPSVVETIASSSGGGVFVAAPSAGGWAVSLQFLTLALAVAPVEASDVGHRCPSGSYSSGATSAEACCRLELVWGGSLMTARFVDTSLNVSSTANDTRAPASR